MAIQMEQVFFLLLSLYATIAVSDHAPPFKPLLPSSYTKSPLIYPSFVPKHGVGLKPYMTQFRSGTRLAPVAIRPAPAMIMSLKRPIKSILSHPSLMKQPLLKRPPPSLAFAAASFKHHKFHSSPPGPSTGEIVFEKLKPITTKLTSHKDGAIHTIPAPNLGLTKPPKTPNQIRVTSYEDSNKLEIEVKTTKPTFTAKPAFLNLSPTPAPAAGVYNHHAISNPHQYQVTEEHSNDVTIGDLYSGKKTYFAPDPDPSLPSKTLVPTSDPLSIPSNGKFAPANVLVQSPVAHYPLQPQTSASAVIQYVNAVPQASYAIPLATQPQLQQHILQQTAMLQEMPVSHSEPAASTGQILSATQDQLHELQSVVNQIQLNDIHNQHSADMPTYAQLVGHEQPAIHQQQLPQLNQLEQQLQQQLIQQHQHEKGNSQRQMTDAEIANLLNYGMINLHNNLSPSDYYHYQQYHHRHAAIGSTIEPQATQSPLRIYVPDGEHEYSNNINAQKRMDEIDFEYADVDGLNHGMEDSTATNAHARNDEPITPSSFDDDTTTNAHYDERTADDVDDEDRDEHYNKNLSNHRLD
uniref:Uncharacterized protein n=1 Tax=Anopheles culicifacies TaxID=139723 RepID=A0A182MNA6_9DIPT